MTRLVPNTPESVIQEMMDLAVEIGQPDTKLAMLRKLDRLSYLGEILTDMVALDVPIPIVNYTPNQSQ